MKQPLPPSVPLPGGDPTLKGYILKTSSVFLVVCMVVAVNAVMFALSVFKAANDIDALEARVVTLEDKLTQAKARLEHHREEVNPHVRVMKPEEVPGPEPDSEFDKPEPKCLDGEKIQADWAPKQRIENKGNRNWCVEVAEGPPKTSDHVMHRAGYECDDKLRKHVAWLRHGLGTRAKDKKRVVRYYNVTHEVAQAICPFLDCSELWLGVTWDKTPGVERTCKVLKGKACDI